MKFIPWIKRNWVTTIGVIFVFYYLIRPVTIPYHQNHVTDITIIAKEDIKVKGGRYIDYVYSIRAEKSPALFVMDAPVNFSVDHDLLKNTIAGDTLTITILPGEEDLLDDPSEKIYFYGMKRNGIRIFDTDDYTVGIHKQYLRIRAACFLFLCFLLLINIKVPYKKIYYVLLALITIVLLVLVEKGIL